MCPECLKSQDPLLTIKKEKTNDSLTVAKNKDFGVSVRNVPGSGHNRIIVEEAIESSINNIEISKSEKSLKKP